MIRVTQQAFYEAIGPLDTVLTVMGDHPYTTEFKVRNTREMVGRVIDRFGDDGEEYIVSDYYLNKQLNNGQTNRDQDRRDQDHEIQTL